MSVYKDAYPERGGSRITMEQTQACIAQKTGSTPVDGFGGLVRQGDAIAGGFRTAGYMECGASEWLIPLSARKNFAWKTEPVPAHDNDKVAFVLAVGFGNGSPLPQSTGQWDIYCNDRFAVSVRVVNHSQLWQAGECSFAFAANRIEAAEPYGSLTLSEAIRDEAFAAFGPALLTVPASWVEPGGPATITVEAKCEQPSTRWFQITSGGPTLDTTESGGGEAAIAVAAAGPVSRGYREEIEHWAWCIRNRGDKDKPNLPRCYPKVALADAVIALTSNIAMQTQTRIEFNPEWFNIGSDETPEGKKPRQAKDIT